MSRIRLVWRMGPSCWWKGKGKGEEEMSQGRTEIGEKRTHAVPTGCRKILQKMGKRLLPFLKHVQDKQHLFIYLFILPYWLCFRPVISGQHQDEGLWTGISDSCVRSMRNIISVEDEELPAITCPWKSEAALQSILIGWDAETRGMSALGLFKGVKCHRLWASTETRACHR